MMPDFGSDNCPFRYPSDPLMLMAWRDFIAWAVPKQEFRDAFTKDTGIALYTAPKNGLDAMIDRACGMPTSDTPMLPDFIEWLNINHWGDDEVEVQPLPASGSPSDPVSADTGVA